LLLTVSVQFLCTSPGAGSMTGMSQIPLSKTNHWLMDRGLLSVKELWGYLTQEFDPVRMH